MKVKRNQGRDQGSTKCAYDETYAKKEEAAVRPLSDSGHDSEKAESHVDFKGVMVGRYGFCSVTSPSFGTIGEEY